MNPGQSTGNFGGRVGCVASNCDTAACDVGAIEAMSEAEAMTEPQAMNEPPVIRGGVKLRDGTRRFNVIRVGVKLGDGTRRCNDGGGAHPGVDFSSLP